jgi:hypothetical protein
MVAAGVLSQGVDILSHRSRGQDIKEVLKMNECNARQYKTNIVVTHDPLVCYGGYGQPACKYLELCIMELKSQGYKVKRSKGGKK